MKKIYLASLLVLGACTSKNTFDASGNFTADEVIVSAEQNGRLLSYAVEEGKTLQEGEKVGQINVEALKLQKEQVEATISSLKEKTLNPTDQVALIRSQYEVQKAQLAQQQRELTRVQQLVAGGAATQKQLDDLTALTDQLRKQLAVTENQLKVSLTNINSQNRNVLSQEAPLQKSADAVQVQINQGEIINPIAGTVLVNYALKGEMQTFGKPLYKIANMDTLTLKAYITGDQLPKIKLGQPVTVHTDAGEGKQRTYEGTLTYIAEKAEFTPKTIQTKSERANLVYAIKVKVKNDGYLKIGMYGEVLFWIKSKASEYLELGMWVKLRECFLACVRVETQFIASLKGRDKCSIVKKNTWRISAVMTAELPTGIFFVPQWSTNVISC